MIELEFASRLVEWRAERPLLAALARFAADSYMLKGAILVALALAVVSDGKERFLVAKDHFIPRIATAALVAIFAGRILQMALPHRNRPFVELSPHLGESGFGLESSFPSDHALYMVCLATAIFLRNRTLGGFAIIWTAFAILTPRIFLNLHYPSDIAVGAAIGALLGYAAIRTPLPKSAAMRLAAVDRQAGVLFYPLAFLFAYSAATNFEDLRGAAAVLLAN